MVLLGVWYLKVYPARITPSARRITPHHLAFILDVVGDAPFPVCVGTSHAGTAATAALSQMAQDLGAAGVMVTPTKEAVPATPATLHAYYAKVAEVGDSQVLNISS